MPQFAVHSVGLPFASESRRSLRLNKKARADSSLWFSNISLPQRPTLDISLDEAHYVNYAYLLSEGSC